MAFHRRGVGGEKPVSGADQIVSLRVAGIPAEPLFAQRARAPQRIVERRVERGVRRGSRQRRPRLTQIVVDRDNPLLEQQRDPRRAGQQQVGGRIVGIGGDRLAECVERFRVIQVYPSVSPRSLDATADARSLAATDPV
jgi:hypothetical protein